MTIKLINSTYILFLNTQKSKLNTLLLARIICLFKTNRQQNRMYFRLIHE